METTTQCWIGSVRSNPRPNNGRGLLELFSAKQHNCHDATTSHRRRQRKDLQVTGDGKTGTRRTRVDFIRAPERGRLRGHVDAVLRKPRAAFDLRTDRRALRRMDVERRLQ
ncbi:hypothetical protein [Burkholderia ubonensis]|uniref:hypothetical protein n=1 Tax=Burkholderia ubonensis TaxID=101571 RepID=UPI0012F8E247|nr:hypothetical protein [Burkholderia ubonensis]